MRDCPDPDFVSQFCTPGLCNSIGENLLMGCYDVAYFREIDFSDTFPARVGGHVHQTILFWVERVKLSVTFT